jgi:hypothetical protein
MNDQTPLWLGIFLCFLFAATLVAMVAGVVAFFYIMWQNWMKRNEGEDDSDNGGGDDAPAPEPPSGPEGDWHYHTEFHRELDLIGKAIEAEREPVLHTEA